jgi:hypothetical protein
MWPYGRKKAEKRGFYRTMPDYQAATLLVIGSLIRHFRRVVRNYIVIDNYQNIPCTEPSTI